MEKTRAPYGSWSSPLTAQSFGARSVTISQVRVDGRDIYWVESSPERGGRNVLLRRDTFGHTSEVLPLIEETRLPDVSSKVHEYGGRAYAVRNGQVIFSDGEDNRVYCLTANTPDSRLHPLTQLGKCRFGDFWIDDDRDVVYAIKEDHAGPGAPVNSLVAIPLDGSATRDPDKIITVFEGTDFVSSPTLSPDGSKLAWITWDHPDMPWTKSRLHVANLDAEGYADMSVVLVDKPNVSVSEPRWTLDGDLIHVDDSSGWASLYRTECFTCPQHQPEDAWATRLRTRALHPGQRTFSEPQWRFGLHSYDNLDDEHLICSWFEDSRWHLGTIRLDNGLAEEWETGWWPAGNVAAHDGRVVFLGDSPGHTPTIVTVERNNVRTFRPSTAKIRADFVSPAQFVSWPSRDGGTVHGYYYAPTNPNYEGLENERAPLIVMVHGGPSAAAKPGLSLARQYWTTRGFSILDVNYRGSTGYGREYRQALDGHYGITDVNDCVDGVKWLEQQGLIDPERVAIRGVSSGGFTVLSALTTTDVFSAGTSIHGISDLKALVENTHKFESYYAETLLKSDDLTDPVWAERSPITHVENINAPLLLLQGREDVVILPEQTERFYQKMVDAGKEVAMILFESEGHGFRHAQSVEQAWRTELSFYAAVWGITLEHPVDVPIINRKPR